MQGFNMGRYHAPSSLDTSLSQTPTSRNPHPLGARARKLPQGILTVRFEMPFAIWCTSCPSESPQSLIGQGVRFNAEKKRVGSYFSTPIWEFRMKHTACGKWIGIKTDPKSSEYIVVEGARRRDTGSDVVVAERNGALLIGDEAEKERRRQDAFAAFEVGIEDRQAAVAQKDRVEELWMAKERDWKDPGEVNARLRREFRVGRRMREESAKKGGLLQDRMSFGYELLEEKEEDGRRAGLIEFGAGLENVEGEVALIGPLFASGSRESKMSKSSTDSKAKGLSKVLVDNTRAKLDPFATTFSNNKTGGYSNGILGIKRKRNDVLEQEPTPPRTPRKDDEVAISLDAPANEESRPAVPGLLVDYDSE